MKTIAFGTLKGGTGKTTNVLNIAGILSNIGKKVLIIDLDLYTGESKVSRAQAWEVAENHVIWDKKYDK